MKGIIFDTEKEAMDWDWNHNKLTGSVSKYRFNRVPLNTTTTLTKAQYAELFNISQTVLDITDTEIPNPRYTELESSYTLDKYASIVNDDLDVRDEEGIIIKHACQYCGEEFEVIEITENMLKEVAFE